MGTSNLIFLGCLCCKKGSGPLKVEPGNWALNHLCRLPRPGQNTLLPHYAPKFQTPPSTGRSITTPQMDMMRRRTQGFMVVSLCVWVKFWHQTGLLQMLLEAEKESRRRGQERESACEYCVIVSPNFLSTLRHLTTYQARHWLPLTPFPSHITYSFLSILFLNALLFFPLKSNKSSNFIISKTQIK